MSITLLYATGAIVASGFALGPLAVRDPKRLRAAASESLVPLSRKQRRMLGGAALLPGVVLMLAGLWPAFLIWFGVTAAIGWALAQGLAPGASHRHS